MFPDGGKAIDEIEAIEALCLGRCKAFNLTLSYDHGVYSGTASSGSSYLCAALAEMFLNDHRLRDRLRRETYKRMRRHLGDEAKSLKRRVKEVRDAFAPGADG